MAHCYEQQGQIKEAADLLERVVRVDQKFQLPKLEENTRRLEALRARLQLAQGRAVKAER
jgi:hypothetical protein